MTKRYGTLDYRLVRDPIAAQNAYIYEKMRERPATLVAALRRHGQLPADPFNRHIMAIALWFAEGKEKHAAAWSGS